MLHTVGLFALAQRRTRPTVQDFEEMLARNHISLGALEDERERVPSTAPSFPLPPPSPPPPPPPDLSELLGPELDGSQDPRCRIHDNLPPFPSRHTYQSTPVMPDRPDDPRLIREMATAEARLAEQALRKLLAVTATKKETVYNIDQRVSKKRKEREDEWSKAFDGLSQDSFGKRAPTARINGNGGVESMGSIMDDPVPVNGGKKPDEEAYLEVVVNSDTQFWRQGGKGSKRTRAV